MRKLAGATSGATSVVPTTVAHTHTENSHYHNNTSGAVGTTGYVILSDTTPPEGTTTLTRDIGEFAVARSAAQTTSFVNTGIQSDAGMSSTTVTVNSTSVVQPSVGVNWFIKI